MTSENVNFKGAYKSHTTKGQKITYKKNDVVLYKGKTYIAIRTLSETSPAHGSNGGWQLFGGSNNGIQFYWGENQPQDINIGDEWFNTATGKTYKYLSDGNSDQWVSIY